jgi:hypothetical protein
VFGILRNQCIKNDPIDAETPKVGSAINSYQKLDNEAFKHLVDLRFGENGHCPFSDIC